MMTINIAVLMDDISKINPQKDSSLALMLAAQNRGWQVWTFDSADIFADSNGIFANAAKTITTENSQNYYQKSASQIINFSQFDLVLMRKNPPFDMNYIYATYLLELAEKQGVLVVNKPQSLRDFNEKVSILNFPKCIPNTLVSADETAILAFLQRLKTIVIKPLDGMGGEDIFKLSATEPDHARMQICQLTDDFSTPIMAQKFIPEIAQGDKRILIINGEPIAFALNRIPAKGNWKGNLAQGASGVAQPLSQRDIWLCAQIAPTLKAKGLLFVGLDVIGDFITEINITSPTGIVELAAQSELKPAEKLLDTLEKKLLSTTI
ncbi:MAG: glutathione synthase [Candidatus Thioglobus sp.]|nr:glutathione synthase [Candidatus Thioglobus sp.]